MNYKKNEPGEKQRDRLNQRSPLPVQRVSGSAACKAALFPEIAAGVVSAPVGRPSFGHATVLRGGEPAVRVQQREEGDEDAQEKCVEIASHLASQASCAGHCFANI